MQTLRRQAKAVSQAVVDSGCLPSDIAQKCNKKGPWASMLVLSEAIEVLHEIVSQPCELRSMSAKALQIPVRVDEEASDPQRANPQQTVDLLSSSPSPIPRRPSSAKTSTSRSGLRRPLHSAAPMKGAELSKAVPTSFEQTDLHISTQLSSKALGANADMCCGLADVPFRPSSPAVLPPLKTPAKMAFIESTYSRPAAYSSLPAMEVDLGFGTSFHGTPPLRRRQSQSLGSLHAGAQSSNQQSHVVLPSLAKGSNSRAGQMELRNSSAAWNHRSLAS